MFDTIEMESSSDRVTVTLSRPKVRNAINLAMVNELHQVCAELEQRPRLLLITGASDVFVSGADIAELRARDHVDALNGITSSLCERIANLPLPTVAGVNGPAIGGGAELAYACDFRVGTTTASFANPEVTLGIMPAAGACWRLAELVGMSVAKEVVLAGRRLSAAEALACGLLSEVVEAKDLSDRSHALIDRLSRGAPNALRLTKLALGMPPGAHPKFDNVAQGILFNTPEKQERMTAFLEHHK